MWLCHAYLMTRFLTIRRGKSSSLHFFHFQTFLQWIIYANAKEKIRLCRVVTLGPVVGIFSVLILHFKVRWLLRKRKADRLWRVRVSSLRQIQAHQGEYCDQVHFEAARAQVDRNCCWGSAETSHVRDSASPANWQAWEYHRPSRVVWKLSRVHLDLRPPCCSQRSVW